MDDVDQKRTVQLVRQLVSRRLQSLKVKTWAANEAVSTEQRTHNMRSDETSCILQENKDNITLINTLGDTYRRPHVHFLEGRQIALQTFIRAINRDVKVITTGFALFRL